MKPNAFLEINWIHLIWNLSFFQLPIKPILEPFSKWICTYLCHKRNRSHRSISTIEKCEKKNARETAKKQKSNHKSTNSRRETGSKDEDMVKFKKRGSKIKYLLRGRTRFGAAEGGQWSSRFVTCKSTGARTGKLKRREPPKEDDAQRSRILAGNQIVCCCVKWSCSTFSKSSAIAKASVLWLLFIYYLLIINS